MSELQGLQLSLGEFEKRGIEVVAVSPDPVARNRRTVGRHGLTFTVLSDPDLALTRALGLVHEGAGPDGADIPRPASFLVRDGEIRWRDLTDNWRIRPRPEQLLAAWDALGR